VRLAGVNTPELRGGTADTKADAESCQRLLDDLVTGKWVAVTVQCADNFGRLVCSVVLPVPDGAIDLTQHMLAHGPGAVAYGT
jgi:endonuclease YncB( thermonuclease family)